MLTWWLLDDFRFFVLNNESGLLEYFVNEQSRPQKPRGMLPLAGAVISPSDEDSHTFTVNAISGEQYKLRGGCHRPASIHVTRQPYHQASTLAPVHQIYSALISPLLVMALRNRCGIRLSFCKGNKLFTLFFTLVSQPLTPKRGNTGWADCRSARSTTQRPWARYDMCVECFHEGIFTAGHNVHYWSLHCCSFAGISSILFRQNRYVSERSYIFRCMLVPHIQHLKGLITITNS